MREIEFRAWLIDEEITVKTIAPTRKGSKGWYLENGYVMRKVNHHPKSNSKGYVAEHRLVMEQYLGRFLSKDEVVHHKDGNRSNNELNNLELTINNSEHIKNQHQQRRNDNGQFVCNEHIFNEIKFRLFDKDRKITLVYTLGKLISTTFRRSKFEFRGRFTGLKDKNGVEIFEGDIVRTYKLNADKYLEDRTREYDEFIGVVVWNEEYLEYYIQKNSNEYEDVLKPFERDYEVIGNIYENEELLNERIRFY